MDSWFEVANEYLCAMRIYAHETIYVHFFLLKPYLIRIVAGLSPNNFVLVWQCCLSFLCGIWILGKSYVYVYVPFILLNLGETPLHIALRQDHYECALLLIARGARLDLPNQQAQVQCLLESVLLIRSDQYNLGPPRSGSVTTKNLQKS